MAAAYAALLDDGRYRGGGQAQRYGAVAYLVGAVDHRPLVQPEAAEDLDRWYPAQVGPRQVVFVNSCLNARGVKRLAAQRGTSVGSPFEEALRKPLSPVAGPQSAGRIAE